MLSWATACCSNITLSDDTFPARLSNGLALPCLNDTPLPPPATLDTFGHSLSHHYTSPFPPQRQRVDPECRQASNRTPSHYLCDTVESRLVSPLAHACTTLSLAASAQKAASRVSSVSSTRPLSSTLDHYNSVLAIAPEKDAVASHNHRSHSPLVGFDFPVCFSSHCWPLSSRSLFDCSRCHVCTALIQPCFCRDQAHVRHPEPYGISGWLVGHILAQLLMAAQRPRPSSKLTNVPTSLRRSNICRNSYRHN